MAEPLQGALPAAAPRSLALPGCADANGGLARRGVILPGVILPGPVAHAWLLAASRMTEV